MSFYWALCRPTPWEWNSLPTICMSYFGSYCQIPPMGGGTILASIRGKKNLFPYTLVKTSDRGVNLLPISAKNGILE